MLYVGKLFNQILCLGITLFSLSSLLYAQNTPEPRTVLALYQSHSQKKILFRIETVLNHLNIKVDYHDLRKGLPPQKLDTDIGGILMYFKDQPIDNPEETFGWFQEQVNQNKKLLLLNYSEAYTSKHYPESSHSLKKIINQLFLSLGLEYISDETTFAPQIKIEYIDKSMMEFERSLQNNTPYYTKVAPLLDTAQVFLSISKLNQANSHSAAVVTTPQGALVLEDYLLFFEDFSEQIRWIVNPFLFFEQALDIKQQPRFDTSTLWGKRIFYTHIDGDGFRNTCILEKNITSGQKTYDEVLTQYSVPHTVSFISAEVDPKYMGTAKDIHLAKKILALPNTEIGVHGFTHPLDWEHQITAFPVKGYSRPLRRMQDKLIFQKTDYNNAYIITVDSDQYWNSEIKKPTQLISDTLSPPHKKPTIYQWTGNCKPSETPILLTQEIGLKNINGGDNRLDRKIPSYSGIAPLTKKVGKAIQIHSSNANENIYTNEWHGPYYAFSDLIETFQQTEYPTLIPKSKPRRIRPINVYYHFYSAERPLALKALHQNFEYALKQDIIPIYTSHFVSVVEGFLKASITKIDNDGWKFEHYDDCLTIRFDNESRFPDLNRSQNISGFTQWEGHLYIHLQKAKQAILYLSDQKPYNPYIESSNSLLSNLSIHTNQIDFQTTIYLPGHFIFQNMNPNHPYTITIKNASHQNIIETFTQNSSKSGTLEIKTQQKGDVHVQIQA